MPTRRRRRAGLAVLLVFGLLIGATGLGAVLMIGRPVDAPAWMRARIAERIAASLPGIDLQFGRVSLLVQRSGLARIILWDVEIRNAQGARVAQVSDIEAGLAPGALLRGQLVLREAQVSGAFVTMRRDRSGRLGLALGDVFAETTDAPDIAEIVTRIDRVFADPRLAQLDLFEADALTLRFEDQRARRGWTADGGRLRLTRDSDSLRLAGDIALLGGGAGVATVELNATSRIGETALQFGLVLDNLAARDIATQSPALAWLTGLDAPISGALRSGLREDGGLDVLNATLQIGGGALQPNRATRALPFDSARTYFTYDPDTALLAFDEIAVTSPLGRVNATGAARLEGLETGWITGLSAQMRLDGMRLTEGALLERPVALSGADAAFKLALDPFRVTLGRLRITDPELPARMSGRLSAESDGWHLALDAALDETDPAQVLAFWPGDFKPQSRNWMVKNVKSGRFHDISFILRARPGAEPLTFIDFGFEDLEATYNPRLPGLFGAAGRVSLQEARLGLRLDRGEVRAGPRGAVDISGTEFVVPDLRQEPSTGELRLQAQGPLGAALDYVDNDAWQVLRKAGRDADLASGRARIAGRIAMELRAGLRLPDVAIDLKGRLEDVESTALVPGRRLQSNGLDLALDNRAVQISGPVSFDGVSAEALWRQPLRDGAGSVSATARVTPNALASLGISLPQGMLSGAGTGALELELGGDGPPRFTLESDLAGIGLDIPQLGWSLPESRTGRFRMAGQLGAPVQIDALSLSAPGLEAEGTLSLTETGGFEALSLNRLAVGAWMDVTGRLRGRGTGQPPQVELTSGRVDLRGGGLPAGGGGNGPGGPLLLALDRLQLTDSIHFTDFRGSFNDNNGLQGGFRARIGGKAPVQGELVPRNGRTGVRMAGEDAGDILRAAGLLRTVQNGTFRLDLMPIAGQAGHYDGRLRILGARLRKAPAIAALLDAASVVGVIDQLNGPGIFFSEVEAEFRLTPSRVILTRSSAVGPSMGISMDGFYDLASGQMDMQGVLSPIYIVNAIGRLIARKGEGLIGFNFNLTGPADQPRVSVNPLSVFTPGMFRDIFRRPPPKLSQ
ncbi:hypothetical protein AVJ23_06675 [Pseudoponticoccus marisrubri]|uniref:YhdP central domain-containing protein n=1 Tax=Pseudoponticoccus marisrubri TaxID=1685382 RepID=A0A0W7WM69_9RHOB|nr:hypothetical protein AVJ23_06675 [Pseudoponticoccus marisrubri]